MRAIAFGIPWTGAFVFLCSAAFAQVIYDNGGPNHAAGLEMTGVIQAENFILTSPANLCGIHFWDFDDNAFGYKGSIVWTIYTDGALGLQPGAILARDTANPTRTDTGIAVIGREEFSNDFDVPCLPLAAGTYWLGLHNGALTDIMGSSGFFWETTDPNGTSPGNDDSLPFDDGLWQGAFQERAFFLTTSSPAVVPEPCTAALLAASLCAGLLCLRRRVRM